MDTDHRQVGVAPVLDEIRQRKGALREAAAARLLGISASWFRHQFTRQLGMSFRTACLLAKLEYGLRLLRATDLSIPAISAILGYSDRTKFEKAVKRVYGRTPKEYRCQSSSER